MRRLLALAIVALGCKSDPAPTTAAPAPSAAAARAAHIVFVPAPDGPVDQLVLDEMKRSPDRRVLVYVGASWCEPCRRFHDAATAGKLDKTLPPLRLLEFDLDRDEARLKEAGYESKYVPLFAAPAPNGRSMGRQIEGSIKGEGAVDEISPRLLQLIGSTGASAP